MKLQPLFLIGTFLLLFHLSPQPVEACSGGAPTPLVRLLEEASIVVKARVLDADAYGQTGVVEVMEYFLGSADANLLLVIQSDPPRTTALLENRHGPGGCATLALPLTPDEIVYLFLARNPDGSYRPSVIPTQFSYRTMAYRFPEPDSIMLLVTGDFGDENTPGSLEHQQITETEFRQFLLAHTQSVPASPVSDSFYPLPAPILLMTTNGPYVLHPDHSAPQRISEQDIAMLRRSSGVWRRNTLGVTGCAEIGCTAYSPNGLDQASVTADGILLNNQSIAGEGFLFSSTNEMVAVWNNNALDFYTFRYPSLGIEEYGSTLFTSHPINQGHDWLGKAAWSYDGRLFAYTDGEGLWLLDVYSQTPRLLLPATDAESAAWGRYFSQGGRYLAITQDDLGERANFDLITGNLLPDGVLSPNERFLIAYDTSSRVSTYSRCILTSPYPCREIGLGREMFWLDANHYMISLCDSIEATICNTVAASISCCSGASLGNNLMFDYEPVTETYLTVLDMQQIEIWDGYHRINHDLQGLIEGEIIAAEWLPSFYSGERTFSETVIQRYQSRLSSLSSE